jgi:hypothetical protein
MRAFSDSKKNRSNAGIEETFELKANQENQDSYAWGEKFFTLFASIPVVSKRVDTKLALFHIFL